MTDLEVARAALYDVYWEAWGKDTWTPGADGVEAAVRHALTDAGYWRAVLGMEPTPAAPVHQQTTEYVPNCAYCLKPLDASGIACCEASYRAFNRGSLPPGCPPMWMTDTERTSYLAPCLAPGPVVFAYDPARSTLEQRLERASLSRAEGQE